MGQIWDEVWGKKLWEVLRAKQVFLLLEAKEEKAGR